MTRGGPGTGELTYGEHGATRGELPAGYRHVLRRTRIGEGEACFERAVEALTTWRMHRSAGFSVVTAPSRPAPGDTVVTRFPPIAGASIPCRIVYTVDEPRRRGFAYGTLAGHPASGEEAFVVEWADDGGVYLSIRAFSRLGTWWARLAGPIFRLVQTVMTDRYIRALRRLSTP